jgi:hypothetical protein
MKDGKLLSDHLNQHISKHFPVRHYPINCVNDNVKEKSIVKFKD